MTSKSREWKLNYAQAEELRALWTTTNLSQRALAKRAGVSPSVINNVILRKTYVSESRSKKGNR